MTTLLVARGYLDQPTSVFGRRVKAAVEEFQARHVDSRGRPLVVDGKAGPLTWWALRNPDNSRLLDKPPPIGFQELPPGGSPAGRGALAAAIGDNVTATPANWCAGFVSWCHSQAPGGAPFRYSLGARDIRFQFKDRGWTYDPGERLPQPGDIVVWWRGQPDDWRGHIGLVHHAADGVLYTIEGNKGGFPAPVAVFDYVLGRIDRLLGFGAVP
jgi:hypothetical protein